MKRFLKTIAALVVVILALWLVWSARSNIFGPHFFGPHAIKTFAATARNNKVYVKLGDTHLAVPEKYFESSSDTVPGEVKYLKLKFLAPDLLPYGAVVPCIPVLQSQKCYEIFGREEVIPQLRLSQHLSAAPEEVTVWLFDTQNQPWAKPETVIHLKEHGLTIAYNSPYKLRQDSESFLRTLIASFVVSEPPSNFSGIEQLMRELQVEPSRLWPDYYFDYRPWTIIDLPAKFIRNQDKRQSDRIENASVPPSLSSIVKTLSHENSGLKHIGMSWLYTMQPTPEIQSQVRAFIQNETIFMLRVKACQFYKEKFGFDAETLPYCDALRHEMSDQEIVEWIKLRFNQE